MYSAFLTMYHRLLVAFADVAAVPRFFVRDFAITRTSVLVFHVQVGI